MNIIMLNHNYAVHTDYWFWRANIENSEQLHVVELTELNKLFALVSFTNRSEKSM